MKFHLSLRHNRNLYTMLQELSFCPQLCVSWSAKANAPTVGPNLSYTYIVPLHLPQLSPIRSASTRTILLSGQGLSTPRLPPLHLNTPCFSKRTTLLSGHGLSTPVRSSGCLQGNWGMRSATVRPPAAHMRTGDAHGGQVCDRWADRDASHTR
jgi:hypothetical protein